MTTINDIHDLALILEQHPEWRAEIRRLVLTDDLLEMPVRMERQEIRMDNLETRMEGLETRMGNLEVRMDRLESVVAKLVETTAVLAEQMDATNRRIDDFRNETNQRFNAIDGRFNRVEADIGDLKGHVMEGKTREEALLIATNMGLQWVSTLPKGATAVIWNEAESAGLTAGISSDERKSFGRADLVVEALTPQGERCYIAVEASCTANGRDTRRVARNARFLSRFTNLPSFAAVACVRIDNRESDIVAEQDAWTTDSQKIYWHEFPEMRSLT